MANRRSHYAKKLQQVTHQFLSDFKNSQRLNDDPYLYLFGVTEEEADFYLKKISNALPDPFLYITPIKLRNDILEEVVTKFILFMAQEKETDSFDDAFPNHIQSSIVEIANKYFVMMP